MCVCVLYTQAIKDGTPMPTESELKAAKKKEEDERRKKKLNKGKVVEEPDNVSFGKRRAGGASASDGPQWKCLACDFSNFATRTSCHRCKVERPKGQLSRQHVSLSHILSLPHQFIPLFRSHILVSTCASGSRRASQ